MSALYGWLAFGVPLLAIPATVIFGLKRTVSAAFILALLMILAPYVYFGIWGLFESIAFSGVFSALSVTGESLLVICGYMLAYVIGYSLVVAGAGWLFRKWRTV